MVKTTIDDFTSVPCIAVWTALGMAREIVGITTAKQTKILACYGHGPHSERHYLVWSNGDYLGDAGSEHAARELIRAEEERQD